MTRLKRATIVLPLVVLLLGAVVPVLLERDDSVRASGVEVREARASGRTAGEWAKLAGAARKRGRLRKALSYIKTAESVSPGARSTTELREIRTARRRASGVERLSRRLTEGPVDHVVFGEDGGVASAHRRVTVLPGESLWTLARDLVAAGRRVSTDEIAGGDRSVHRAWDALTALNGVRELEVGERVRVPLFLAEQTALADANRRDHERIAAASRPWPRETSTVRPGCGESSRRASSRRPPSAGCSTTRSPRLWRSKPRGSNSTVSARS